jgi:hypothetical protein
MEKLIELRQYIVEEKEQAFKREFAYKEISNETGRVASIGYQTACSDIIEQLDLILNNSVVKPSERRSPTDESFSGCKPPERKAKSTEENLECKCSPNRMCSNCVSKFSHIC